MYKIWAFFFYWKIAVNPLVLLMNYRTGKSWSSIYLGFLDTVIYLLPCYRATLIDHMLTIHEYGIRHGDLEPRNIVVSPAGKITVIDFEMSDQTHCCEDKKCMELDVLRNILQVDVERSVTTKTTGNGKLTLTHKY
jgi:RIO-like serine/threonine protein kinase